MLPMITTRLPISGFGVSSVLSMQNVSVGPYDFNTHSFPLTSATGSTAGRILFATLKE